MTDPNSLYRKLYNRSLDFFLWAIDQESPPYKFKLHIQAQNAKELKVPQLKRSIELLIPVAAKKPKIDVQFFTRKNQFKAFISISEAHAAKEFFSGVFTAKTLRIVDANLNVTKVREMRAYVVKTEEEFTRLAMLRYLQDISLA